MALGSCPDYQVYIRDRARGTGTDFTPGIDVPPAAQRVGVGPPFFVQWTSISWGRRNSSISAATVELQGFDFVDCIAELSQVRPWSHWVEIWRDGVEVWEGPVVSISFDHGADIPVVRLDCQDGMAIARTRLVSIDRAYTATDPATIFGDILDDAFALDTFYTAGYSTLTPYSAAGVVVDREYQVSRLQSVYEELASLSAGLVEWTMLPLDIIGFFGEDVIVRAQGEIGDLPALEPRHFARTPRFTYVGDTQANAVYVGGSSAGFAGFDEFGVVSYLTEGDPDPSEGPYTPGVLMQAYTEPQSLDAAGAQDAAYRRYVESRDPHVQFDDAVLGADCPFDMNDLIPRRYFVIDLSSISEAFPQRMVLRYYASGVIGQSTWNRPGCLVYLDQLDVDVVHSEGGVVENVRASFVAPGE